MKKIKVKDGVVEGREVFPGLGIVAIVVIAFIVGRVCAHLLM